MDLKGARDDRITGNCIEGGSTTCIQAFSVSWLNIPDNIMSLKSPLPQTPSRYRLRTLSLIQFPTIRGRNANTAIS